MESLSIALSVVFPMLVYMLLGGFTRKMGFLSQENFRAMNTMIFKIMLPLSLFFSICSVDLAEVIVPSVFGYTIFAVVGAAIGAWYLLGIFFHDRKDRATLAHAIYRSNYVLFGTMIAESICGASGAALASALASITVPLFNIVAVVLFELVRGGKINFRHLILSIFKNPLVDAGIVGILFSLTQWQLPELLESPLHTVARCATPMALIALGGLLSFHSIVGHMKELFAGIFGKLLVVPAVFVTIAILLGFRGVQLVTILAVLASPTAVASAPMAQSMGGNGDLAGELVALSSVFSIVTLFGIVWLLSAMGMF